MEGGRVAVRILGVASTTHGFAFAAVENHESLVDLDSRRTPVKIEALRLAVDIVLERTRPLFVACAGKASRAHVRKRLLVDTLASACAAHGIMVLWLETEEIKNLDGVLHRASKTEIALALASTFPELRRKLPPNRTQWNGDDHRIGLFMALAAAVAAWKRFRPHP